MVQERCRDLSDKITICILLLEWLVPLVENVALRRKNCIGLLVATEKTSGLLRDVSGSQLLFL